MSFRAVLSMLVSIATSITLLGCGDDCQSHDSTKCISENGAYASYWYDSCGEKEDLLATCNNGCNADNSGCETTSSCNKNNCDGCCDGTVCRAGDAVGSCGKDGEKCKVCNQGQTCTAHACITPSCSCADDDQDGHYATSCTDSLCIPKDDCDDTKATVYFGAPESPFGDITCADTLDNDCDGLTDIDDPGCKQCQVDSDCDDENICTDDDCDPGTGCNYTNNTSSCNDNNACTSDDVCGGGVCGGNTINCDDNNICTDDACVPSTGCTHTDNTISCNDSNDCTMNDTCSGGNCVGEPLDADGDGYVASSCGGLDCDDTKAEVHPGATETPYGDPTCSDGVDNDCDSLTDMDDTACKQCQDNTTCDDHNACNGVETCDGTLCHAGTPPSCVDDNICTDDGCDSSSGCTHTNNTFSCNDNSVCTTDDVCSDGICSGTTISCDDDNICTDDGCDASTGCTHTNNTVSCNDNNECTLDDVCGGGICGGTTINCDDGNPCTDDICNSETGVCGYTSNTVSCNDNSDCTTDDVCGGGICGGTTINCDDDNVCTDDGCDVSTGCTHTNNTVSCNDNSVCTTDDVCGGGTCDGNHITCDDNNLCTDDDCDPSTGCTYSDNTLYCDDGDYCTTEDVCGGGACAGILVAPGIPSLLSPENGALTGSFRAPSARNTLRPLFRWRALEDDGCGPVTYDIQIDDSCTISGFANCGFPSPEASATGLNDLNYRPGADLPLNTTQPVGRLYYWRIRACREESCSSWTAPRYLSVGRTADNIIDFNGDGYSDVVIGSYRYDNGATDEGNVFVYYGGASGIPATPSVTLDNPANQAYGYFGWSVASAGDVNGDGYSDLIVGAFYQDAGATNEGNAFVYYGSSSGIPTTPSRTLDNPVNQAAGAFGWSVASAGDVNGDGYADVIVGAYWQDNGTINEGNAFVYYGSASGIPATPSVTLDNPTNEYEAGFGWSVASAGDVNGDGYADLIVGAYRQDLGATDEGNAFVYYGSASGILTTPSITLDNPSNQVDSGYGYSVASAGDVNGDGFIDVIVGAPGIDTTQIDGGQSFLYFGSASGLPATPSMTLDNPINPGGSLFGYKVGSAGDVNGDGYPDVVVLTDIIFYGSASGISTTSPIFPGNWDTGVASPSGDVNGDGYADFAVRDSVDGSAFVYYGGDSGIPTTN